MRRHPPGWQAREVTVDWQEDAAGDDEQQPQHHLNAAYDPLNGFIDDADN